MLLPTSVKVVLFLLIFSLLWRYAVKVWVSATVPEEEFNLWATKQKPYPWYYSVLGILYIADWFGLVYLALWFLFIQL